MNKTKHQKKFAFAVLLALFLLTCTAVAAASDTRIDEVSITIEAVGELKSGEEIQDVSVSSDSDEYSIDSAYFSTKETVWQSGETPLVCVELYAEDGYRFSYTSKSHFSLSGFGAKFKRAKITDGGDGLLLYIELKKVSGKPLAVENPYWRRNEAHWDKMSDAEKYEVRLYRGNSIVTTQTTSRTHYDFTGYMTQKGRYSFRVRSVSKADVSGSWSDYSDDRELTSSEAKRNAASVPDNNSNSNNNASPNGGSGNHSGGPITQSSGWIKGSGGWWYRYENGSYPVNSWQNINNRYYYFDANGYSKTGWQSINNKWYYLDGSGAMTTGWQYINNKWYYLNSSGAMLTGWQYINDKWYFLESSGAMLTGWQYINNKW
ncbi:MAG: N-acetylmuramoyl-L-alanine amidase family protein, partial [bacterium]|nr:N-acetylmuramoyl-L-alanine amidase family protein [bacterium]